MSKTAPHYDELLKQYEELSTGIRMIRRAVEKARRTGVLPSIGRIGTTPLEDCEEIARVIYAAAAKPPGQAGAVRWRNGMQMWSDG
jgi:hypothetical protein